MNREELLAYIDHHKLNGRSLNARTAKHKDAYVALCTLTSFMDTLGKVPSSARIRALREDVNEIPMCSNPTCSNTVGIALLPKKDNEPSMKYFARNCSAACARSSPVTRDLRTKTMIDKYGGHNMQTEKGRAEYVAGVRAKYGVDNPNQTAAVVEKGKGPDPHGQMRKGRMSSRNVKRLGARSMTEVTQ